MRIAFMAASLLTTVTSILAAGEQVPFGGERTFTLSRPPEHDVLALGGWFNTEARYFGTGKLVVILDGRPVQPEQLLSPRRLLQPRHAMGGWVERIDTTTQTISFPATHRDGGLADYQWQDRPEYDKWVPLYNDFPQTVYIQLPQQKGTNPNELTITLAHGIDSPRKTAVGYEKPPFVITEMKLLTDKPAVDEFGPYIPPVWSILDAEPALAAQAVERLNAADTSAEQKGQILTQFGMLNLMKGHTDAAVEHFRRAVALGPVFPEHHEVLYRLLRLTGEAPLAKLAVTDDNPGRWAALYHDYRRAAAGEPFERVVDVPWRPDDQWDEQGLSWHPVAEQISGDPAPPNMMTNQFAMLYTPSHLVMVFRGPGTTIQPRDVPGDDRPAWEFNCVELFVAPRADFTRYYEMNVTAANGRFDQRSLWHGVDDPGPEYQARWRTDVVNRDDVLHVTYRVPWTDFGFAAAPQPGDLWAANVVRVQFTADTPGGKLIQREFSAGKLLWRYFHRIQDGHLLRFGARAER